MAAGFALTIVSHIPPPQEVCSFYSNPLHQAKDCSVIGQFPEVPHEQVNAVISRPVNDPYSHSYNPGWRNHPNLYWRPPGNPGPPIRVHNQAHPLPPSQSYNPNYRPHQYHYQSAAPPINSAFEDKVLTALGNLETNTQLLNSHSQSIAKL
jgi:hypothetical protein